MNEAVSVSEELFLQGFVVEVVSGAEKRVGVLVYWVFPEKMVRIPSAH